MMSGVVREIHTDNEESVRKTLEEAKEFGFTNTVVFGFIGDQVVIKSSGTNDVLKMIGMLEAAKMQLWSNA